MKRGMQDYALRNFAEALVCLLLFSSTKLSATIATIVTIAMATKDQYSEREQLTEKN